MFGIRRLPWPAHRGILVVMEHQGARIARHCAAVAAGHLAPPLLRWLLPPHCLLCGAGARADCDLCPACAGDMPRNRVYCARCALPLATPGAACGDCLQHPRPWRAAWVPYRYGWPLNRLQSRFKFSGNLACGRALARLWLDAGPPMAPPDCLVPVPLHRRRLHRRGYNQALELARPLARAWDIGLRPELLQRRRHTPPQSDLDAVTRRRNLRRAFAVPASMTVPGHVALLDDVMTTGATLAECTRTLKRAGAVRVDVWALARVA